MVKVIRLQKPLPNAVLTAIGEAPLIRAASATTTTAIATKIKASGNQRSAHAVKAIASRTSAPSCCVAPPVGAAAVLVIAMMNPSQDPTLERLSRPCPQRRRQAGWAPLLQCPHVADDASAIVRCEDRIVIGRHHLIGGSCPAQASCRSPRGFPTPPPDASRLQHQPDQPSDSPPMRHLARSAAMQHVRCLRLVRVAKSG